MSRKSSCSTTTVAVGLTRAALAELVGTLIGYDGAAIGMLTMPALAQTTDFTTEPHAVHPAQVLQEVGGQEAALGAARVLAAPAAVQPSWPSSPAARSARRGCSGSVLVKVKNQRRARSETSQRSNRPPLYRLILRI